MTPLRILASLSLVFFASSCVLSKSTAPAAGPTARSSAKKEDDTGKKQHALEVAELKLQISKLEAAAGAKSSDDAVADAAREAEEATEALENFTQKVRPLEEAATQLSLDRGRQRVLEAQQELDELEAMYAQEQFADLTKELVLSRGRSNLEMARRNLELEERRAAQKLEFDLPNQQRDLGEKAAKATKALEAARARAEKGAIERKLSLLQAEHARDEASRAAGDDDDGEGAEGAEG